MMKHCLPLSPINSQIGYLIKQELMGKATLSQSQRGPGPFYNRTVLGKTNG